MKNLCAAIIICVLLGCGCSDSLERQGRPIALCASLGEAVLENSLQTKAADGGLVKAVPFAGTPSGNNKLDVALWFSNSLGQYSHDPAAPTFVPCATTASYTSSTPMDIRTDGNLLQYPIPAENASATDVYCVGFHPSSYWGAPTDGTTVTSAAHAIDGSTDLLFADQMVGSYNKNFPSQTFNHLLTWVKINLSATSVGAARVWGDVEHLQIVSPNNTVKIEFSQSLTDGKPSASTVTHTGETAEFSLSLPDGENGKKLNITSKTFGQAFCAPPENSSGKLGYIIKVKTQNMPQKELFVPLMDEDNTTPIASADYAVGKLFVINLHFNEVAIVEGVCTLRQWDDQNSEIYLQ